MRRSLGPHHDFNRNRTPSIKSNANDNKEEDQDECDNRSQKTPFYSRIPSDVLSNRVLVFLG